MATPKPGLLLAALMAAGVLSGSAFADETQALKAPPGPNWDLIAFETKSWGAPLSSWRVGKEGSGSWVEAVQEGNDPRQTILVNHEIDGDVGNYIALERIFSGLPVPAPDPDDCNNFMPDMPYGTIRLTRGATTTEIAWNAGCMDPDYLKFLDLLKQADSFVSEKGRTGKILWSRPAG